MQHQKPFSLLNIESATPLAPTLKHCQWEQEEKIKFAVFVYFFKEYYRICCSLNQNCWKFWRKLSLFLLTKNPNQCRIYHKNILKNYQTQQQFLDSLTIIFSRFSNILDGYQSQLFNIRNCLIKQQSVAAGNKKLLRNLKSLKIKEQYCQLNMEKVTEKQKDVTLMRTNAHYNLSGNSFMEEMDYQKYSTLMFNWMSSTSLEQWAGYREEEGYRQCHMHFLNYLHCLSRVGMLVLGQHEL